MASGQWVMAMPNGADPTGIGVPATPVEMVIGKTLFDPSSTTKSFLPVGVIPTPLAKLPAGNRCRPFW
jgi:hypothetical protein